MDNAACYLGSNALVTASGKVDCAELSVEGEASITGPCSFALSTAVYDVEFPTELANGADAAVFLGPNAKATVGGHLYSASLYVEGEGEVRGPVALGLNTAVYDTSTPPLLTNGTDMDVNLGPNARASVGGACARGARRL